MLSYYLTQGRSYYLTWIPTLLTCLFSFVGELDINTIKEIFFEVFRVPALFLADESLLVTSLAEKQTGTRKCKVKFQ